MKIKKRGKWKKKILKRKEKNCGKREEFDDILWDKERRRKKDWVKRRNK